MRQTCSGFFRIVTGPFSCKTTPRIIQWPAGQKTAILHHLICSSHANKSVGGEVNRTNSTSPPPHYTAHTQSPFWLWQKNNNNTIVFVGFTNGREAGEHYSPPVIGSVQVLMPLRGCVSFSLSPCQPNLNLFPEDDCFVWAQCPPPASLTIWGSLARQVISF